MKTSNTLFLIFTLLFISSCSDLETPNEAPRVLTEREKITEKYRKMRLRGNQKTKPRRKIINKIGATEDIDYNLQKEDLSMEVQQFSEYFCITRKNNSALSDPVKCKEFINKTLNKCKSRYQNHRSNSFQNCVKRKLGV